LIHRSPEPDIEIPEVTLTEHVVGGAAPRGDHPAFIDGISGEATTYAELAAKVDAAAAALQADGIGKGEVVGLIGPNSAEWGIAYHGILRAGAVVTPMNPLLTPEEIGRQVENAGANLVIDDPPGFVADAPADGNPGKVAVDPEDLAVLP
jgi:acyl-CoA synthetase (AMP-forming)/AMP-acid ligase II